MKKIIYIISLILVISLSSICCAADSFETDSKAMYTELRHMGMNFDVGISYISFKDEFRHLYQSYSDYSDKYSNVLNATAQSTPDKKSEKAIYHNITSCFNIYNAVNTIWMYDVDSRSTNMKKVDWIWSEFPELNSMHRDWLGGYDTKKVMWTILGCRKDREYGIESEIDMRYQK
jgi:hypothetical protein